MIITNIQIESCHCQAKTDKILNTERASNGPRDLIAYHSKISHIFLLKYSTNEF